jgi:phytoene dehydrogenase-like protein
LALPELDPQSIEQYSQPGGVTAPYEKEGYRWDLGQMLIEGLGPDEPLGAIQSELGVLDKIRVKVDDRRYVFPDFEINKPKKYTGLRWRIDYLKGQFPGDAAGLERYWKDYLRFTSVWTRSLCSTSVWILTPPLTSAACVPITTAPTILKGASTRTVRGSTTKVVPGSSSMFPRTIPPQWPPPGSMP